MPDPLFRLVCSPAAVAAWMAMQLEEGELALLADGGGLEAVTAAARSLHLVSVQLLRAEADATEQERTVMTYADARALVWVAPAFGDAARAWARDRGPMTLLVEADREIPAAERQRIERFVAVLGRQAE